MPTVVLKARAFFDMILKTRMAWWGWWGYLDLSNRFWVDLMANN